MIHVQLPIDRIRHTYRVKIVSCPYSSHWYAHLVGQIVTCFAHDEYGHWTRDTGEMRLSQWVADCDAEVLP